MTVLQALGHLLGIDSVSSDFYALWSGIAGDLGIIAAATIWGRKHNCHTRWCWRIGRHPVQVDQATYVVCRRHHPGVPTRAPTAATIAGR